jgi:lipopolysaccharide biosynthesis glycosyltransferase
MIRLFIGSSSNGEDATIEAAYLNSIEKHASTEVELTFMRQTNNPTSFWHGWQTETWPTPFSGFRWGIAEYCGFEGRAIYTDCDMINYRDMQELMDIDMEGKPLAARKGTRFGGHEFCVTVIDCAAFREYAIPVQRAKKMSETHQRMIRKFSGNDDLVKELDPRWNCLDGEDYDLNEIYQLHFTNMATQPWTPGWFTGESQPHPRKDVVKEYERALEEARGNGYNPEDLIPQVPFGSYDIIGR